MKQPSKASVASAQKVRGEVLEALQAGHPDQAAFILYLSGYPYHEIVRLTGYADWKEARRAINRLINQGKVARRDMRQQEEIARLNRLEKQLQPQIEDGNVSAIQVAIDIGRERRRILADNEPARVAPPQLPSQEEINRFVAGLQARGISVGDPQAFVSDFQARAQQAGYLLASAGAQAESPGDADGEGDDLADVDAEVLELEAAGE